MTQRKERLNEVLVNLVVGVSTAAVALFLIVIFKLKGGLIGLVLGAIAVTALVYWLMEIRKIFTKQETTVEEHDWLYDLIEEEEGIIFVARVPGPPEEVKVKIINGILEVRGGGNFIKRIPIPKNSRLLEKSYANGVLRLRLQRSQIEQKKLQ
ncbi:MAG: Hsp20/alpha crystallin family protein [Candidatus Bathyarchaeia archaeon]|nr:Hsp20/alpha crystallin family protein [Candidatus Bathyarchaeota archaeon]